MNVSSENNKLLSPFIFPELTEHVCQQFLWLDIWLSNTPFRYQWNSAWISSQCKDLVLKPEWWGNCYLITQCYLKNPISIRRHNTLDFQEICYITPSGINWLCGCHCHVACCISMPPASTQPTTTPDQNVYHARTHFREKSGYFFDGRCELVKSRKRFHLAGTSARNFENGLNFAFIYFYVWIVMHNYL